jgi:hypothetical protein
MEAINVWILDWLQHNPVEYSVNWVCAQECAIRLLHTLQAYVLLQDPPATESLIAFVSAHCIRIERSLGYALAQKNNHAISEAAALYIAGSWLIKIQSGQIRAKIWQNKGFKNLQSCAARWIAKDGSFSMYSTYYHRMVVSTFTWVLFLQQRWHLKPFDKATLSKVHALVLWLYKVTDTVSGQVPNLGNNDGSNPYLVQTASDYQDFRPCLQFAFVQCFGQLAYPSTESTNEMLIFLLSLKKAKC